MKCWMFFFRAEGFFCNLDVLYGGQGIGKMLFFIQKKYIFFNCNFFQFLVIKTLNPYQMKTGPKPCYQARTSVSYPDFKTFLLLEDYVGYRFTCSCIWLQRCVGKVTGSISNLLCYTYCLFIIRERILYFWFESQDFFISIYSQRRNKFSGRIMINDKVIKEPTSRSQRLNVVCIEFRYQEWC